MLQLALRELDATAQRGDAEGNGCEEELEVQELLRQRLLERASVVAARTAEQFLLLPAKTTSEWAATCDEAQKVLQQQLEQQIQPLCLQTAQHLQVPLFPPLLPMRDVLVRCSLS